MFGDDDYYENIAERMLEALSLETILEISDVTEVDALARLIELGLINVDDFVQP